jgi:NAD(P)-dependent dehydrogenase (short-subunit alcohol dehydrogenase family)
MCELKDKKFVVTGASRGLGSAVARALLSEGALVAVCSRNIEDLKRLYTNYGERAIYAEVDLKDQKSIDAFGSLVLDRWSWVDGLVNNASTLGVKSLKYLLDTAYEELEEALKVNYLGALKFISVFIPSMVVRRRGVIVNLTSDVAVKPAASWGAYAASKAALECMSYVLAEELRQFGVRVHLYDPGDMDTELHRVALPEDNPEELLKPEHSAKPLVYLLSDGGKGLSGRRLSVYDFQERSGGV